MHVDSQPPCTMNAPPPQYVMLTENNGMAPPPYRRNVPRYNSHGPKKRKSNSCLRCICCCYCFLILLILILAGAAYYYYSVYQPKVPSYKVENLTVKSFDIKPDFSVNTELLVFVKAENPNKVIGFIYGSDSSVVVYYKDTSLCSGKLPEFHQGHENTTVMKILLKGETPFGSDLQAGLSENKKTGKIPLTVVVKAPMSVVIGEYPFRQFVVRVKYYLIVDDLSPEKQAKIISSQYTVGVTF